MKRYIGKRAAALVSALALFGCGSQKTIPSLEEAGKMEEPQLKEELSGVDKKEINAAWGEGADPFFGVYGEVFPLDEERALILYYEGDGQTVEDVRFGENIQAFEGTIREIHGVSAVVEADEGFQIRNSGDLVSVTLDEAADSAQPGDGVRVTYSGAVMESYPLQLGNQKSIKLLGKRVQFQMAESMEPSVIKVYEVTDPEADPGDDGLVTMVRYYEMSDGTWKTDGHTYQYRLEITGRMGTAAKDTTFVFLSNIGDITFEQAWKASGLSSSMDDYFKEEDAVFVAFGNR